MLQVIIVGGPADVFRKFKRRLHEKGLDASWHWEWKKTRRKRRTTRLPKSVEGVVILKSMIGHSLRNRAIELAKASDVPYVEVEPNCKAMSSIDLIFKSVPVNNTPVGDSPNQGSIPASPAEIREEKIMNSWPVMTDYAHKALELKEPAQPSDAMGWAELILEEKPELILDLDGFLMKLSEVDVSISSEKASQFLTEVRSKWVMWGTRVDHHSKDFRSTKDRINKIKEGWLARYLSEYEGAGLPTHAVIKREAARIFGSKFQNDVIRKAKLDLRRNSEIHSQSEALLEKITQRTDELMGTQPTKPNPSQADFDLLNQKVQELTSAVAVLAQRVESLAKPTAKKTDNPSWMDALKTLSDFGLDVQVKIGVSGDLVLPNTEL